jgi:hypothetical protein
VFSNELHEWSRTRALIKYIPASVSTINTPCGALQELYNCQKWHIPCYISASLFHFFQFTFLFSRFFSVHFTRDMNMGKSCSPKRWRFPVKYWEVLRNYAQVTSSPQKVIFQWFTWKWWTQKSSRQWSNLSILKIIYGQKWEAVNIISFVPFYLILWWFRISKLFSWIPISMADSFWSIWWFVSDILLLLWRILQIMWETWKWFPMGKWQLDVEIVFSCPK